MHDIYTDILLNSMKSVDDIPAPAAPFSPSSVSSSFSIFISSSFDFTGVLRLRFAGGEGSSSVVSSPSSFLLRSPGFFGFFVFDSPALRGLHQFLCSPSSFLLFVALRLRFAGEGSSSVRGPTSSSDPLSSSSIRRRWGLHQFLCSPSSFLLRHFVCSWLFVFDSPVRGLRLFVDRRLHQILCLRLRFAGEGSQFTWIISYNKNSVFIDRLEL
ncbi:hypothetical protein V2J09_020611 [Rumex salicifolius]